MSKRISIKIALLLLLIPCLIHAQQRISINANNQPISQILTEIDNKSEYTIYYLPQQLDSLYTSINFTNEDPLTIIEYVLKPTKLQMSVFKQSIFILENVTINSEVAYISKDSKAIPSDFVSTLSYIEAQIPLVSANFFLSFC